MASLDFWYSQPMSAALSSHLAFFQENQIDVGVELVPAKTLQREMSSGVGFYEWAVYQLSRLGRNSPALPLVVVAIAP